MRVGGHNKDFAGLGIAALRHALASTWAALTVEPKGLSAHMRRDRSAISAACPSREFMQRPVARVPPAHELATSGRDREARPVGVF